MYNLIVVGFKKDKFRASEVLNELSEMNDDWVIDLKDAVAAYRDDQGKLRVDQSYQMTTGEGAALGGLWGSLIGLTIGVIAAPVTAGASAAVAAGSMAAGVLGGGALGAAGGAIDADWWRKDYGISEDFVRDVGAMVQPGDSAIFALLRRGDRNELADRFRGYGGTIIQSSLTKEQADKVQAVLDGKR